MIGVVPSFLVAMWRSLRGGGFRDPELVRVERVPEEGGRGVRVVQERERAAGAGPGHVGQAPLLLEGSLRLGGIADGPPPGEAVGEHEDVIPLEALRAMCGREAERGIVPTELREPVSPRGDG